MPTYGKVRYEDVYQGIDLVYYGNQQELEYDFEVAPGISPRTIQLEFEGAERVRIDQQGNLVIQIAGGEIIAEGRVGGPASFETYVLLANPNTSEVTVTITYLQTDGATVVKHYTVPPTSRFNVYANGFVPELVDESFGAVIESTLPIAVERAMYSNAFGTIWAAGTNATATRLP